MNRGTPISRKPAHPVPVEAVQIEIASPHDRALPHDRLLTTAEANAFLRRAPGFLEKRRSSGIDSPKFIQSFPGGPVRYRVSDLLQWEEAHLRTSTFA